MTPTPAITSRFNGLNRRAFLSTVGAGGLLLGLAACGSDAPVADSSASTASSPVSSPGSASSAAESSTAGAATGAGFTYTDARGTKIDLPTIPARIVAQSTAAATLLDVGVPVVGAYGELKSTDGELSYQAGQIDLSKITVIGSTYGEFNVEQYAALQPELLIDMSFDDKSLWYVPADAAEQILALAPSLAVKMIGNDLPAIIEEFVELGTLLGADPNSLTLQQAKTSYDSAVAGVKAAVAANPGLKVLAVSRDLDKVYIADPKAHPDLAQLAGIGVNFTQPSEQLPPEYYFQELSWERIGEFAADAIIYDVRETPDTPDAAKKIATWEALPAVKAGQVYPWKPAAPYSYRAYGEIYGEVAAWIAEAKVLS